MMTIHDRLDVIEEKLDKIIELLEQPRTIITGEYPRAPYEITEVYPLWQQHETSSSP